VIDVGAWLDARRPEAPAELRSALDTGVREYESGSVSKVFRGAALRSLDSALARPGRVRESAFELLAADALLTFACEAALESEDPCSGLTVLLTELLGNSEVA